MAAENAEAHHQGARADLALVSSSSASASWSDAWIEPMHMHAVGTRLMHVHARVGGGAIPQAMIEPTSPGPHVQPVCSPALGPMCAP